MPTESEVERMVVRLVGDTKHYQQSLKAASVETAKFSRKVSKQLSAVGTKMRRTGRILSTAVTLPLVGIGTLAAREFAKFDQAMIESTSIMQVTENQTKRMRDTAISLSGEAAQAPQELARSYFFLASAGKDAEQSMALLPQVSKFATAGAFDMALATDLLTDAQSALGLSSKNVAQDTENLSRVSDVLVKANTLANASVQQFAESLTNTAGATMKSFNKDVEEGVAVLAAYADQGVKGAVAGTNFSRINLLLSKSARDSAKAHEELGFKVFDTQGKMRNYADIIKNLEDITRGMSDEVKAATLEQLGFEARIQQAILPLLGTSDAIRRYEKELRNAGGTTEDVANKQMRSFSNQLKILKNQITVAAIELGETLVPAIKSTSEFVKDAISWWRGLDKSQKETVATVGAVVAAIGPLVLVFGTLAASISSVISIVGSMAAIVGGPFTAAIIGAVSAVGLLAAAHVDLALQQAKGARLDKQLVQQQKDKTQEILELAKTAANPEVRNAFLAEELKTAEKRLEDYNRAVRLGINGVAGFGDSLELMQSRAKAAQDQVDAIKDAMTGGDRSETQDELPRVRLGIFGGEKTELPPIADPKIEGAKKKLDELTTSLESQVTTFGLSANDAAIYTLRLQGLGDEETRVAQAMADRLDVLQRQKEVQDSVDTLTSSLQEQVATFGMTSTEAALYRLKLEGATEAQLKSAKAAADQLTSMEKQKSLMEKGEEVTKKFASPQEKLAERQSELKELLDNNAISLETYNKALKEAENQANKDITTNFKVTGVDAVAAGSAEAAARIQEFFATNSLSNRSLTPSSGGVTPTVTSSEGKSSPKPVEDTVTSTMGGSDKAVDELTLIREGITELVEVVKNRTAEPVSPAGLL